MYPYAFLIGDLIFLGIWILLFWLRKDLRREMLAMSIICGALFPLALIHLADYWQPEHIIDFFNLHLGIEDFLFAFVIGGIGGVLHEALFGQIHKFYPTYFQKRNLKEMILLAFFSIFIVLLLTYGFNINSIYSSYVSFLIIFAYIIFFRKDLFQQAILGGISVGILMLIFYQIWTKMYPGIIESWWKLENLSGIFILNVPLEEILWGFSWGLVGSVIYEFAKGISIKSKNN
ncbi:hypothetical protein HZC33_02070 [Candidatus Wolfebacteria bacterium]|nr:hypothetical protein [Candidatus Wolfebacteria bacterium]